MFSGLFMSKMVGFIQSYFPVFLLGAIFGKLMEISGFAKLDRDAPSSRSSAPATPC
jgi:H+/gluconate symporter-like permease